MELDVFIHITSNLGAVQLCLKWMLHFFCQAIQDITRTYEIPPEEIVTLIYDKIDVNGEGKEVHLWPGSWFTSWCSAACCFRLILMCSFFLLVSSGELTLEEFISGAREHPDIMEMLTKMMDLSHVLEIIIKGQKKNTIKWGWRWWKRVLHMSNWEPSPELDWALPCRYDLSIFMLLMKGSEIILLFLLVLLHLLWRVVVFWRVSVRAGLFENNDTEQTALVDLLVSQAWEGEQISHF